MFQDKVGDTVVRFSVQIRHLRSSRRQILIRQIQRVDLRFHCFDKVQGNASSGTTGPWWEMNVSPQNSCFEIEPLKG